MMLPINFMQWIEEHRHLLKPPIGNKVIWNDGDFICMVVGGPNQRTDFHYDEGPEFFYQIEGDMTLRIMENGAPRDIEIKEGEIFLLPPKVPHSPQRYENTVGLVIERQRTEGELDGLMWYCQNCNRELYSQYFVLTDVETQFPPIFAKFNEHESNRRCPDCDLLNPTA